MYTTKNKQISKLRIKKCQKICTLQTEKIHIQIKWINKSINKAKISNIISNKKIDKEADNKHIHTEQTKKWRNRWTS